MGFMNLPPGKYRFLPKAISTTHLICTFPGTVTSALNVLGFNDLLLLSMVFPNMTGLYFLHQKVKKALRDYMKSLKNGGVGKAALI